MPRPLEAAANSRTSSRKPLDTTRDALKTLVTAAHRCASLEKLIEAAANIQAPLGTAANRSTPQEAAGSRCKHQERPPETVRNHKDRRPVSYTHLRAHETSAHL
eukprot:6021761-Alexandrium_andersonii.AAC.1